MILDLLFPPLCAGCQKPGRYLCLTCEKNLEPVSYQKCIYCGKSSLLGLTHPNCRRQFGLDGVVSCFAYNRLFKNIITAIKFRYAHVVCRDLFTHVTFSYLKTLHQYHHMCQLQLQPIPLHPKRFRERGFNQAAMISYYLADILHAEQTNILDRTLPTQSQSQLRERKERYRNVWGAFSLRPNEKVRRGGVYALVDDIVTSGHTAKEACKILKEGGAHKVFLFTLGRG
jgi:competence protein ComFC